MTITAPGNPFSAFAVGRRPGSALAEMVQYLGPGLTDHRGLIDLPALTVLFDDIGGLPFFYAGTGPSMQARLSMSMLGRPAVEAVLEATAEVVMSDDDYGVTSVLIRTSEGAVCTGTARSVRVGRDLVAGGDHMQIPEPTAPTGAPLPSYDPAVAGRELVERIAAADAPIGALAELLGGSLEVDDVVTFRVRTAPWMGNIMGTMHGGVIGAAVAQGLSFAAQAATVPGVGYQLTDFTVDFLRSPAVDGRTVEVRTSVIKTGRRIGVFVAEMYDGDALLAHATAEALFLPA